MWDTFKALDGRLEPVVHHVVTVCNKWMYDLQTANGSACGLQQRTVAQCDARTQALLLCAPCISILHDVEWYVLFHLL